MIRCPICKIPTGYYWWANIVPGGSRVKIPYPLYQYRYPDNPDYISPRCLRCYNKQASKQGIEKLIGGKKDA